MQHLLDTTDLSDKQIIQILEDAKRFKHQRPPHLLRDKLLITLFLKIPRAHEALLKLQPKDSGLQ